MSKIVELGWKANAIHWQREHDALAARLAEAERDAARYRAPDATDHAIVRIEHHLLAMPLLVTAHFAPKEMNWKAAKKWAEKLDLGGFSWRLPTVEEAFFIPDRSKYPAFDPSVFVGLTERYPWIWAGTVDAKSPSGYAWGVDLNSGYSFRNSQDNLYHVLAVRAGQ